MDDTWEGLLASPIYEKFAKRKAVWNNDCAKCEYFKYCAGCCPKNRPAERGGDASQLSELCEGWKQFYRHTLQGFRRLAEEIQQAGEGNEEDLNSPLRVKLRRAKEGREESEDHELNSEFSGFNSSFLALGILSAGRRGYKENERYQRH